MGPKKLSSREEEAVAAENAAAAELSRAIFDDAVDSRMISRVRPSSLKELVPSKTLRRSDCKDIHKKSSVRKSRYMIVFPGQLASVKDGQIGSLAKLDTQNPVMYVSYGHLGRLKLVGTIVRSKATRYFTLNVKSRDRTQLEDWFDSMIVFSRYSWVGTPEENPGEEPMPFPEQLQHVAAAAAATTPGDRAEAGDEGLGSEATTHDDGRRTSASASAAAARAAAAAVSFDFSVAAEEGAKPLVSVAGIDGEGAAGVEGGLREAAGPLKAQPASSVDDESDGAEENDEEDEVLVGAPGTSQPTVTRPRRESAKAVRYNYDAEDEEDDDDEELEDAGVFRGRATSMAAAFPRQDAGVSTGAKKQRAEKSGRAGAGTASGVAKKAKNTTRGGGRATVIELSDDTDDDKPLATARAAAGGQRSLLGFLSKKDDGAERDKKGPGVKRSSAEGAKAAPAQKKSRKRVLESDDEDDDDEDDEVDSDSDEEPEDDDSDFEA